MRTELTAQTARIAIYGAGAMGTALGAFLVKGGLENVELITRNAAHVEGLRASGATVVCSADNTQINVKVRALFPEEMSGQYDVIFLMTKQKNNAEILTGLLPYMREDTAVCTTQNGLPEPSVAAIVGEKRTYGAATSFGASFLGCGKTELTSKTSAASL